MLKIKEKEIELLVIGGSDFLDKIKIKLTALDPSVRQNLYIVSENFEDEFSKLTANTTYRPKIIFLDENLLHNEKNKLTIKKFIKMCNMRGEHMSGKIYYISKYSNAENFFSNFSLTDPKFKQFLENFHREVSF